MNGITILLTILGLSLFEVVNSIDNAVINAEVLTTMKPRGRTWFLSWGLIFAVLVIRGIVPWLIVWLAAPTLGPVGALTVTFQGGSQAGEAIGSAAPLLLAAGGSFLFLLFAHWLFMEEKHYGIWFERRLHGREAWFYGVIGLFMAAVALLAVQHESTRLAIGAAVGLAIFFVLQGLKQGAEPGTDKASLASLSDTRKIIYLEVIDSVFSIDGVLGAFAFTFSVPLILIGNGIGAIVMRQVTMGNLATIKKYHYLKNGAMYSLLFLGLLMLAESLGHPLPSYLSPLVTFMVIGFFFYKSRREIQAS